MCFYRPTERERTERLIKMRLREIMMLKDLENVTCKEVRGTYTCGDGMTRGLVLRSTVHSMLKMKILSSFSLSDPNRA